MMTIGINGNEANVEHRVGVGQYAFELLSHLNKSQNSDCRFQIYLENKPQDDMPKVNERWEYKILGQAKLWTLTRLQFRLIAEKLTGKAPDIFFTPSHYTPFLMPMPSVVSIMDMSFERFPKYFKKRDYYQLKYWTYTSIKQAAKVLTISEFSKEEICKIYGFDKEKVIVTYPGFDKGRFKRETKDQSLANQIVQRKYKITKPYLLYLGTLQPRKNLTRLIEAFALLDNKSIQLAVVGMKSEGRGGWMYEKFFDKVKELDIEDRIIFTGYVPDDQLPILYTSSIAYVLPSLYEGFGIPPIEAMACGTPVVVSKTSSLPEICGKAAIYIDNPDQVDSIKAALNMALAESSADRENRIKVGLEWVKRYNWEDTAKQTLEALRGVLKVRD